MIENDFGNGFFKHFTTQAGRFNEFVKEMYGRVYLGSQFLLGAKKFIYSINIDRQNIFEKKNRQTKTDEYLNACSEFETMNCAK